MWTEITLKFLPTHLVTVYHKSRYKSYLWCVFFLQIFVFRFVGDLRTCYCRPLYKMNVIYFLLVCIVCCLINLYLIICWFWLVIVVIVLLHNHRNSYYQIQGIMVQDCTCILKCCDLCYVLLYYLHYTDTSY
jgi:hypothetical protein